MNQEERTRFVTMLANAFPVDELHEMTTLILKSMKEEVRKAYMAGKVGAVLSPSKDAFEKYFEELDWQRNTLERIFGITEDNVDDEAAIDAAMHSGESIFKVRHGRSDPYAFHRAFEHVEAKLKKIRAAIRKKQYEADDLRHYYIVYNKKTMIVVESFRYFNDALSTLIQNPENHWFNVTHPTRKELLAEINRVNGTDYK